MLINMKCPSCGASMQFDNTKEFMFCQYCGGKIANIAEQVNINQQVNVTGTVIHVQDRTNEPNLFITYNTINPSVGMVTRIVSSGVKNTYVNGQTLSFHLNQGQETIIIKIGKKNYSRSIVIPQDNSPVRIYASFNGRAQIAIDQPTISVASNAITQVQTNNTQFSNNQPISISSQESVSTTPSSTNASKPVGKPKAPLSILAFVFSLTFYLSWAGASLGAVETFVLDKENKKNHLFSFLAMGIGTLLTFSLIFGLGNKSKNTVNSISQSETSFIEALDSQNTDYSTVSESEVQISTPAPTATPTPTPTPTNTPVPTATPATTKKYNSLGEYAEYLETVLDEMYDPDSYTITVDEDNDRLTISFVQFGASVVASGAIDGDQDCIDAWNEVNSGLENMSRDIYQDAKDNVNVRSPHIWVVLLNDLDTDYELLMYLNGTKFYDVTK